MYTVHLWKCNEQIYELKIAFICILEQEESEEKERGRESRVSKSKPEPAGL